MEQLRNEFHELDYDLLGLKNLIYLGVDPNPTPVCPGGSCDGGCTNGCFKCSPGNKND